MPVLLPFERRFLLSPAEKPDDGRHKQNPG
jgi:hypothetical protein